MDDNSIILACLCMVCVGALPFLYMFDDKADHSEGGFKKYIWKTIKDAIVGAFFTKVEDTKTSKEEEKPTSSNTNEPTSSPKEEQPA